jgi:carbamoyl-phosphate synthase small subunit
MNHPLKNQTFFSAPQIDHQPLTFKKGYLHLDIGLTFVGKILDNQDQLLSDEDGIGEMVFTTAMVGYEQTLTDPSFAGQNLVFTYPLIGNYPLTSQTDFESDKVWPRVVVCYECSDEVLHWLTSQQVMVIQGVDTRKLTQVIRDHDSSILGTISSSEINHMTNMSQSTLECSLLEKVVQKEKKIFYPPLALSGEKPKKVVLIDCGVKLSIVRELLKGNCIVEVVPYKEDFTEMECDGWLFSNGPGDPQQETELIQKILKIIKNEMDKKDPKLMKPILGICLGYQLMALGLGAKTEKLKYGHRGHNHSVIDVTVKPNKGYLTSQNHGYEVIESTLPQMGEGEGWQVWFRHLQDNSLEGLKHSIYPFRGVQFHPEASSGPMDTLWIIEDFIKELNHV